MSTEWVAGNVRAKAMLNRRLGGGRARAVAAMGSLEAAQQALVVSPYSRGVRVGQTLAETEHAVTALPLWHLRVLAGWQPREGAQAIRSLAAGFEAANIDSHARRLAGATAEPEFLLGTLTTAWSRLRETSSLTELRDTLSQSAWGDPGGDTPADIAFGVHVAWALRVAATVPDAASWACGASALLVARRRFQQRRELPQRVAVRAGRILNPTAVESRDLASFTAALPAQDRWALAAVKDVGELWRGEVAWWLRLERDGFQMLGRPAFSRARTIGAAAVLGTDAWRCRAALQLAARGGGPMDAYDAVA